MLKLKCVLLLLTWTTFISYGQKPPAISYDIDTITLFSSSFSKNISDFDTIGMEGKSIYQLENSFVQIQTNGPGSLMTPFLHGLGSRHTAVIWKGINVQSPLNGSIDLNLVSSFNNLLVSPRSVSSFVGTSGLSGALVLQESSTPGIQLDIHLNSFNNRRFSVAHQVKKHRYHSRIMIDYVDDENRYNYNFQGEKIKQQHAGFNGFNVVSGIDYFINDNLKIVADIWWQNFNRSIAPSKTAVYNNAVQEDDNTRISVRMNNDRSQMTIGILSEGIIYQDAGVYSKARTNSALVNLGHDFKIFESTFSFRRDAIDATYLSTNRLRNTWAVQLQRNITLNKDFDFEMVLRNERFDHYHSPLLFLFSGQYKIRQSLTWKVSIDRSYNIPTINDLYWPTGGNPSLNPEKSVGINTEIIYNKKDFSFKAVSYLKNVNDWIVWVPGPNFWSPLNQRQVQSKGMDLFGSYKTSFYNLNVIISPHFHLNHVTITEDIGNNSFVGNQVIYVPKTRWGIEVAGTLRNWKISVNHINLGSRFTGFDNEESVAGFNKIDFSIIYNQEENYELSFAINNILNEDYERVAYYAMPLRNYNFGLKVWL